MNVFLLLTRESMEEELDKVLGRRNWTQLWRPGEYLLLAAEQRTTDLERRLGICKQKLGVVLPFTGYYGFIDSRILEKLESWYDRRRRASA